MVVLKVIIGFITLILGVVGIVVPILPTTPFLIVSIACFSSTPKIKNKILSIPFIKEYYDGYTKKTGLRRGTVVWSLMFLWVSLIVSAVFTVLAKKAWIIAILAGVGIVVSLHILYMANRKNSGED